MNFVVALAAVVGIFVVGLLGPTPGVGWVLAVVFPYVAVALFAGGLVHRVVSWARVPVPFRIPTTCGQQKSLTWIENDPLENPHNGLTAVGRMILEVLFFRSLLKNTKSRLVRSAIYPNRAAPSPAMPKAKPKNRPDISPTLPGNNSIA